MSRIWLDCHLSHQEPRKPQLEWENTVKSGTAGMTQTLGFSDDDLSRHHKNASAISCKMIEHMKPENLSKETGQRACSKVWVGGAVPRQCRAVWPGHAWDALFTPKVCTVPFLVGPWGHPGESPWGGQPRAPKGPTRVRETLFIGHSGPPLVTWTWVTCPQLFISSLIGLFMYSHSQLVNFLPTVFVDLINI